MTIKNVNGDDELNIIYNYSVNKAINNNSFLTNVSNIHISKLK